MRGNDAEWDYERLTKVGAIAQAKGVRWLTTDFNCTVTDPAYVNAILDRLMAEQPRVYQMILYVEQPFPYDLEANQIDVHSVSARKPLFMDESAHDWRLVRLGRRLGWSGSSQHPCATRRRPRPDARSAAWTDVDRAARMRRRPRSPDSPGS